MLAYQLPGDILHVCSCVQQRCFCGSSQCRLVVGGRTQKPDMRSDNSSDHDAASTHVQHVSKVKFVTRTHLCSLFGQQKTSVLT